MRILFISEKLPYPLDTGGNIRTYHILRGLSERHEITLATTIDGPDQQELIRHLNPICERVVAVQTKNNGRLKLAKDVLSSFVKSTPVVVARHYFHDLQLELSRILSGGHFDAVHFNHLDATAYMPSLPGGMIRVLDEHNIVSNQVTTAARSETNGLRRHYMNMQRGKTERYEKRIAGEMSLCLVCSDVDKEALSKMVGKARIAVIPNGVDVNYFDSYQKAQNRPSRAENNLVFVGTLDYGPCEAAVHFFSTEILPRILSEIPDITFTVVGRNPSKRLQKLAARDRHIVLTGWVADIRPYLAAARIFVAPLLSGSGTRIKILEAMAMGKPIVSTGIGAEGIEAEDGADIVIADTPNDFSSAVTELIGNESRSKSIGDKSRALVREKYSWEGVQTSLLAEYQALSCCPTRTLDF